jgi:hypothetical protein
MGVYERMDAIIEVRTEYGGSEYFRFNRFHLFRKSWYIAYLPVLVFLLIGMANWFDGDRVKGVVMAAVGLFFPLIMLGTVHLTAKRHLKTNKMYASMKHVYYSFDQDRIYHETNNKGLKTTIETGWDNVYRSYEAKDSFYIYISNMQAFIIPKKDIVAGTADEFRRILQERVGSRHRKMG